MARNRNFIAITTADFIARAAYQMGKTPLLPIFAASLGAGEALLGFIVSVSVLTGMVLKPFVGILSDRWGRRRWLIAGTIFFAFMPFLYRFVETPNHLLTIRLVHGLATAIYGPVTLAYVSEQHKKKKGERLGLFGMARSGGFVVGPALGGWLLLSIDPVQVYTIIGLMSCAVFVPVLLLPESAPYTEKRSRPPIRREVVNAFKIGARTPSVWLSGGLEGTTFVALYAVRAFLPIYALSLGVNAAVVGLFFSVQEAVHALLKPIGGRIGDRIGYLWTICLGMAGLGLTLPLLTLARETAGLMGFSVLLGAGQALFSPSVVALVSAQINEQHVGAGMGLIGMLSNMGKVLGPIVGGLLIESLDYSTMFWAMGVLLLMSSGGIWYWGQVIQEMKQEERMVSL